MTETPSPQNSLSDLLPADLAAAGGMDAEELSGLIQLFHDSTASLRTSHEQLRLRIESMETELAGKNKELSARVEEVSALKNYLANILESISDGVLTIGLDHRLVALNGAAATMLPEAVDWQKESGEIFSSHAQSGSGNGRANHPEIAGPLSSILNRAMDDEETISNVEVRVEGENGSLQYLSVSAAPIRNATGLLLGAVATFRDNTEVRSLEKSLQRRDRLVAMGEMSAQLAHEIRNPLGGIELYASLLDRALAERPEEQALAQKISVATTSLNRLVEDMLTFTRPSQPDKMAVTVEALMEGALMLAGPSVLVGGLRIEREFGDDGRLSVDPDLIQRALLNVILNAVQIIGGEGTITLGVRRDRAHPTRLQLLVADTGPGVPEELKEQIFNPFFTRRQEGTGLGLAIVQKILQDHDGTIWVEDCHPTGARFVFDLPVGEDS
ncbi:MAG: two-component system sensor histidine kinase NtrB [Planctomycetota bacterium]|jgi:signal transduction histidine kinase